MHKVLGIGNALVDIIIKLSDEEILKRYSLPKGSMQLVDNELAQKIEKDTLNNSSILASGGSAANTIHGLAKLGITTGYIGKIGKDKFGDFFNDDIRKAGINPHIEFGQVHTGRAITLVTPDSERTFATYLGSAIELTADDFIKSSLKNYSLVHVEGYLVQNRELVDTIFQQAKLSGLTTSLDLASYNVVEANLEFLQEIIKNYVDIVFANEEEALAFTGEKPMVACNKIAEMCDIAIVKTGKSGSIIQQGKEICQVGVIPVNVIDTTGAGDLYAAGFIYGVANNFSLKKCGEIGALLAGKVIENLGAKIPDAGWLQILNQKTKIEK